MSDWEFGHPEIQPWELRWQEPLSRRERTVTIGLWTYLKLADEELLDLRDFREKEVTKWNNFQMARKIQINSLYGALGNQYFRHYRLDTPRQSH